jgi:predicted phage-related endonuclease
MNAPFIPRGVHIHCDFEQGSTRWLEARCGLLTASEFDRILTPTLKVADNPKSRAHLWEMAAQRISGYVEPSYISDAMLRGQEDEILAREDYSKHYAPVRQCGFVTNDKWGFTLGCSPDGLVGDEGLIECKSRGQKFQVQTVVEHYEDGIVPDDFILQVQGLMLVTERKWCDLISRCGGLHQITMRVEADPVIQEAIVDAAAKFESRINEVVATWNQALASGLRLIPTERREEEEMVI